MKRPENIGINANPSVGGDNMAENDLRAGLQVWLRALAHGPADAERAELCRVWDRYDRATLGIG